MKNKYEPNEQQKMLFDNVVKAIQAAQKHGLTFYGLQFELTAYNKASMDYIQKHGEDAVIRGRGGQIPNLSASVLHDSGADDLAKFIDITDNPSK